MYFTSWSRISCIGFWLFWSYRTRSCRIYGIDLYYYFFCDVCVKFPTVGVKLSQALVFTHHNYWWLIDHIGLFDMIIIVIPGSSVPIACFNWCLCIGTILILLIISLNHNLSGLIVWRWWGCLMLWWHRWCTLLLLLLQLSSWSCLCSLGLLLGKGNLGTLSQ